MKILRIFLACPLQRISNSWRDSVSFSRSRWKKSWKASLERKGQRARGWDRKWFSVYFVSLHTEASQSFLQKPGRLKLPKQQNWSILCNKAACVLWCSMRGFASTVLAVHGAAWGYNSCQVTANASVAWQAAPHFPPCESIYSISPYLPSQPWWK